MKKQQMKLTGALLVALLAAGASQAVLIANDSFNTTGGPDYVNGLYTSGADLKAAGNATCSGGSIVGFETTTGWAGSGYYDAYANMTRLVASDSATTRWLDRGLTADMSAKTSAFGSMVLRAGASSATVSGEIVSGFSNATMGSPYGVGIGYKWDGSNWDMVLRYNNDVISYATITEDVAANTYNTFYWSMDQGTDTVKIWVNNNDYSTVADLTVADWAGTVSSITHFSTYLRGTSGTSYLDEIKLGDTGADIGMIPEPATLSLFGVVALGALMIRRIKM